MNLEDQKKIVTPGRGNTLLDEAGKEVTVTTGWAFLPAGDAGITRKITAKGVYWRVQVKKGRRLISKGVWAPAEVIEWAKAEVESVRSTDAYKKRIESDRKRRDKKQVAYEAEFMAAVKNYLSFATCYQAMETQLIELITKHTIPVGSGTVARTAMIPIEDRAGKAVIAWMRHQTTAYDSMTIARIKGKRREARRMLAKRSAEILHGYRKGEDISALCPLRAALDQAVL
jgi:hypothetical protein